MAISNPAERKNAQCSASVPRKARTSTNAANIDIPPTSGISPWWDFLSFGESIRPIAGARRHASSTIKAVMTKAKIEVSIALTKVLAFF
jgi:hypothetical protein